MTEDDLEYINHLDTRSSYSEGKRACECYCYAYVKEYGVNVTIARLVQTFGPGVADEVVGGHISVVMDISETNNYGYTPTVKYYLTADKLQALGWASQINMKEGHQLLMDYLEQET